MRIIEYYGAGHPLAGQIKSDITVPDPVIPNKIRNLSWEDFRKLFTDAELEILDSYDMTGCAVVLNDAQKIKIRTFIKKGESRGAGLSIDVTTAGMDAALTFLEQRGIIAVGRKAEIQAGVVKS